MCNLNMAITSEEKLSKYDNGIQNCIKNEANKLHWPSLITT